VTGKQNRDARGRSRPNRASTGAPGLVPGRAAVFNKRVLSRSRLLRLWLPVVLWLGVILSFSTEAASAQRTSRFLGPLIAWLFPHWDEATRAAAHVAIRKTAHVTEYALLAVLLLRALRGTAGIERNRWQWRLALLAVVIAAAVAGLDESLQSRSATRTGSPRDVALDTAGALLGVAGWWCLRPRARV
jgi:VanZ family protein